MHIPVKGWLRVLVIAGVNTLEPSAIQAQILMFQIFCKIIYIGDFNAGEKLDRLSCVINNDSIRESFFTILYRKKEE